MLKFRQSRTTCRPQHSRLAKRHDGTNTLTNPLTEILSNSLSEIDVGIMHHGWAPHGRDYVLVIEDSIGPVGGTLELTFTHVVQLACETRVRDEIWPLSWADEFTDYSAWEAAGEPNGYVFGVNWSNAYPGFKVPDDDADAARWSGRIGKPMYAATLETNQFLLTVIYSGARIRKLSDNVDTVSQTVIPLPG